MRQVVSIARIRVTADDPESIAQVVPWKAEPYEKSGNWLDDYFATGFTKGIEVLEKIGQNMQNKPYYVKATLELIYKNEVSWT